MRPSVFVPIGQLSGIANLIQLTIVSAERVFELLDEPEETPDSENAKTVRRRAAVRTDNVSFRYRRRCRSSTTCRSHRARADGRDRQCDRCRQGDAGEPVDAVLRRRQRCDSRRRRGYSRRETRFATRMFGMVLQDTWLFTGTIRENIAYGRERQQRAIVNAAAAQADHFIRTLPENYETPINEAASSSLSEGQKQLRRLRARSFRPGGPDSRRGHEQRRHAHGGAHSACDGRVDARQDDLRDRASAVDNSQRRRGPDDGTREDRRDGHAP
jgi:ATP-binding cassette subfamily B protein